jgi:PTS system nitrogen regulatory IIA component
MDIKDLLKPSDVEIGLRAADKHRVLLELSRRAASSLSLDPDAVFDALLAREALGSTGMGDGIAIPHARPPQVKRLFGILARLKNPVDFEAIDGQPVDLVFLLLLPAAPQGGQLNALASVARRLRDSRTLSNVRTARDAGALFSAFAG